MSLKINWRLATFSILLIILFLYLGNWQINRAQEKTESIQADEIRRTQPGVSIQQVELMSHDIDGTPVNVIGHFLGEQQFLLDNIVLNGTVGFEVLMVFKIHDGAYILVNRGFVPMGLTRDIVPVVPTITNPNASIEREIHGNIYVNRRTGPAKNFSEVKGNITIVQSANPRRISELAGLTIYPHLIRLSENDADALPRYWPVVVMLPARHMGYAVTWLLMALAVVIAFASFTYQTNKEAN